MRQLALSDGEVIHYFSLPALADSLSTNFGRMPFSVKVMLELMLRMQDHAAYDETHVVSLAGWKPGSRQRDEYPYLPSRVLLQDFTGVPCLVDLAAMRHALRRLGADPSIIEPRVPVNLVIDHSVQIDEYLPPTSFDANLRREFERNRERYAFLHWGQNAFAKLEVLPPGLGICHQVNMEYLASCVTTERDAEGRLVAKPDTLVGTDSHTTMINSMGIVGWGVGGIEAEAAMLGQPIPVLTPRVIGCRLVGRLAAGCTPTDAALHLTQTLREAGVVGSFVEYFGSGLDHLTVADRAPLANMAPEYGATMGLFPIDEMTLRYLGDTGRSDRHVELVRRYCQAQGMFRDATTPEPEFDQVIEVDLAGLAASVAGPKRPQDRIEIDRLGDEFARALTTSPEERGFGLAAGRLDDAVEVDGLGRLRHGSVVIAAITSCTNTSNPTLMIGAGLMASKALAAGLQVPSYVKTSFAPGSRAVNAYLQQAGLLTSLEKLGFRVVAYGCTTCIGNSGPLLPEIDQAIKSKDLVVAAVLSGNRNFEGRIHPLTKANYLCSPLLVVAYALCGRVDIDLTREPLGIGTNGKPVMLADIWPSGEEISALAAASSNPELYRELYADVAGSSPEWSAIPARTRAAYEFDPASTYIREPPFFQDFGVDMPAVEDIHAAAVLALLGDFITTDHISPAGSIQVEGPAGQYLIDHGVEVRDFNSFGARRGNHEVMMRGTLGNIRIRNQLVKCEGGLTIHHPTGEEVSFFEASRRYRAAGTPLVILAGKLYGAGSSRDWAAKGVQLLGVRAVIAESYERIHRSNLVGMGVLPLQFRDGESAASLGLQGSEVFTITGIANDLAPRATLPVTAVTTAGECRQFEAICRLDSSLEVEYYLHGGVLQYVLRSGLAS